MTLGMLSKVLIALHAIGFKKRKTKILIRELAQYIFIANALREKKDLMILEFSLEGIESPEVNMAVRNLQMNGLVVSRDSNYLTLTKNGFLTLQEILSSKSSIIFWRIMNRLAELSHKERLLLTYKLIRENSINCKIEIDLNWLEKETDNNAFEMLFKSLKEELIDRIEEKIEMQKIENKKSLEREQI
ncbi:MAG: hypothetical protein ACTSVW_03945 [Candidatus Njordarchaeales archaeon]